MKSVESAASSSSGWGEPLGPVVDALTTSVVVLDRKGRIVATNATWRRTAEQGGIPAVKAGAGADYLAVCDAANDEYARRAAGGLRSVLRGDVAEFRLVYPCDREGSPGCWFLLRASRSGDAPRAPVILTHDDVTDLTNAEGGLRDVAARLLRAQDEERRLIARELHDGTAPTIVALSLDLARLAGMLPEGPSRDLAQQCVGECEQALREMRTVAFLLHPPLLERYGLAVAVQSLAEGFSRRSGVRVAIDVSNVDENRLAPDVELALYRVSQEALLNVHRHSGSATARVRIATTEAGVELEVADDGVSPPPVDALTEGVGILGMRQRLRALGGRLDITTGDHGRGLVIRATVPPPTLS
jgi:two-component system, NarL family, sensor kinase